MSNLAHEILRDVRSTPEYLADETGLCFEGLLTDALSKLPVAVAETVEVEINLYLATLCKAI